MPAPTPIDVHDERALLEGLVRQDRDAREAFLRATHRPVFYLACRLTRDPDLRQDWAQAPCSACSPTSSRAGSCSGMRAASGRGSGSACTSGCSI